MYYYGYDWTYIILVLPFVILSLIASYSVKSTFKKFSEVRSRRGFTGAMAADHVLRSNGITNVRIERISGNLTDHFDPKTNVIRLSDDVYGSTSVAAIGVACHEAGHAVQHAVGYGPIKLRSAIIPVTNIGSKLAMPLILIGLLLEFLAEVSTAFVLLGVICFSFSVIFQLITLPVEFNASSRAISAISSGYLLYEDELHGAKKTLTAAAMTYVAATAVALMQLLRLVLILMRKSRD